MTPSLAQFAAVALGGAAGSVLRFWISSLLPNQGLAATASVNFLGSLLLGAIVASPFLGVEFRPMLRLLLAVGFCGGFTTFSTFGFQTFELLQDSRWLLAITNILANNLGSILCVWIGYSLARSFLP